MPGHTTPAARFGIGGRTLLSRGVHPAGPAAPVSGVRNNQGADPAPTGAGPAAPAVLSSADIADLLDVLAAANSALTNELKAIAGSRRSLSQATVNRLEILVAAMRPAARVREVLAELEPLVLLAGAREWHRRRPVGTGRPR